ncbi:MAG: serine/threonine protein phosphatase [Bacteroidales bacterium]|nr:serine/threonine protein phosphatase [Bacteroidales bacterium]
MGRRLVISDIHGCSKTLLALLKRIELNKEDNLYFLGDYIDRGPDSSGVLDIIIDLKKEGYNIFPLLGNHEQQALNAEKEYDKKSFFYFMSRINKSDDLLNKKRKIKKKYRKFMQKLPLYFELDDFIIVHAGFDFTKEKPFEDEDSILNIRNFKYNKEKAKGKTIVFGHAPTYYKKILKKIKKRKKKIPLDNGCVYNKAHKIYDFHKLRKLCCFNLDTYELICQENIELNKNIVLS